MSREWFDAHPEPKAMGINLFDLVERYMERERKPIIKGLPPTAREVRLRCPNGHKLQKRVVLVGAALDQICPTCGESARIRVELNEEGHTVIVDG